MGMKRTSGVGRHTGVIPEALGVGAIGSRHEVDGLLSFVLCFPPAFRTRTYFCSANYSDYPSKGMCVVSAFK